MNDPTNTLIYEIKNSLPPDSTLKHQVLFPGILLPDIGCKERPVRFNIQAGPVFIFSATVVKEVWAGS